MLLAVIREQAIDVFEDEHPAFCLQIGEFIDRAR